jgi:short-subunit dehydrogenase
MTKVIGITGVAGGIGRALVKEFKAKGFDVIGVDIVNDCPDVHYFKCDLTDEKASVEVFGQIQKQFPEISYWFNNAGLARLGLFLDVSQNDFDLVMKVNFNSQVIATRFWLPFFQKKGKGTIINMASAAGLIPTGGMSSYVASKHALVGFTRSLQVELEAADSPLKLVLVTPGFVETSIMQIGEKDGLPEKLRKLTSTPESCAKEIVSGILEGKKDITPTMSGKVMTGLYRMPFGDTLAGAVYKKFKGPKSNS